MSIDITGSTALVTGGASGIGLATARLLAEHGARVAVLDRVVEGVPSDWLALTADVRDTGAVDAALARLAEEFDQLDILVNCAGVGAVGSVDEATDEEWQRVLDINVVGIGRVMRAALPLLRRSGRASVVNITSIVAAVGLPRRAVYSASKGAVVSLTYAMATDHLADGIRVNAVSPGTADTPWVQRLLAQADDPEGERRLLEARQPTGRLVTPDEVANAVLFLAGPMSSATTGAVLAVDGGVVSLRPRPPA
jgi:2-keto-3-deoxy-L-fuconate dehydrogenase